MQGSGGDSKWVKCMLEEVFLQVGQDRAAQTWEEGIRPMPYSNPQNGPEAFDGTTQVCRSK